MNFSKSAILKSKIIETIKLIFGSGIAFISGIPAIMGTFDKDISRGNLVAFYIITAIGILMIVSARKQRKLIRNFDAYYDRFLMDPTGSINNLVRSLGSTPEIIKNDIQQMINKKFFDAYIDETANRIVFVSDSSRIMSDATITEEDEYIEEEEEYIEEEVKFTTINCKNCGGINKVAIGKVQECDFCGSPISCEN